MAAPGRPPRILVADDDVLIRAVLWMALSGPDCMVDEAGDAAQVAAALTSAPADLVILDISMPGGGVEETIACIHHRAPDARILVLSGDLEAPASVRSIIDDFARKPIELDDLRERVDRLLPSPQPSTS